MSIHSLNQLRGRWPGFVLGAVLLLVATYLPWLPRLSRESDELGPVGRWSYDALHALLPEKDCPEVQVIEQDQKSYNVLRQDPDRTWDRRWHADLLRRFTRDGARLVVFDVFFSSPQAPQADAELARAMTNQGAVAVALDLAEVKGKGIAGRQPIFPPEPIRAAARLGTVLARIDQDGVVRRAFFETELHKSLPWVAAELANAAALAQYHRLGERWTRYYGPSRKLPRLSYADALTQPANYFRGKCVFIGGSPEIKRPGEAADAFHTPYTAWDGQNTSGVELAAIAFLNLLRGDAWQRLSIGAEFLLLLLSGSAIAAACVLGTRRMRWAVLGGAAVVAFALGLLLPALAQVWFSWLIPIIAQVPAGVIWSLWLELRRAERPAPLLATSPAVEANGTASAAASEPVSLLHEVPFVADHTLLRRVGTGAYGDVWVARNAVGILHAVKVIHRRAFESSEPFEREFRGITRFMPISRSHPGFVHVLQAGPEEVKDYFYYVMELADDATPGEDHDVDHYRPTTLASQLKARKRLTPEECLQLGLQMTDALSHLHEAQLIHRDVKPSNIIFVHGLPKLADIGLVTRIAEKSNQVTFLGTRGYLAPEGPGSPAADIYSLGKVLYEAYTGLDREQFPSLPTSLLETPSETFAELNQIVLKACELDPNQRYQSAAEFHRRLAGLQARLGHASEP